MHAGAAGAVQSAAALYTTAVCSQSRSCVCFEPLLKFDSQRHLHPAVSERCGGWSSYFLASPHSQAVPMLESTSKKMSVWGRQRDVPFKCLSVFPSLKPDRDFIIYNYCNFLLLSYNAKCLCGYFYTSTLLSGSWGLCKDVTCEFWVILWSHCIMNALICMWLW